MKKTLAILTLVVMLAALIVPVAMADVEQRAACDHPGSYIASETQVGPRYYSNSQHGYAIKRVAKCTACDVILTTSYANWTNLSAHIDSGNHSNMEHLGNTNYHKYSTRCSVCSGGYTINKWCPYPCTVN